MSKTTKIKLGNLAFQARLEGGDYFQIEKRLKKSIFNAILGNKFEDDAINIPPIGEMTVILSSACKTVNVTERDIIKAIEKYFENGGTSPDIYGQVMTLLEDSGFFGKTTGELSTTETKEAELV
jgi:hypothetical protein